MNRILVLAAAAALIAVPAAAGPSVHVPVAGKTSAQIQADVTKAAKSVCFLATANATFRQVELEACMKQTVASAMSQLKAGELASAN
jgi:hypothetical protein